MTETDGPNKNEIALVFKKLRAIAGNKSCFDCGASNPTWSSVTYGVFICIDCSAVHRGLGVHLTFVRSTNLDTNWTWLQVRAMQVGGNANALQFFRQHGCTTSDAQQKYRSRAAQLYRDKLHHLCAQAQRMHGAKLFLDSTTSQLSPTGTAEEVDFFAEHTAAETLRHNQSSASVNMSMMLDTHDDDANGNLPPANTTPGDGREPSVESILTRKDSHDSTTPAPKTTSIGSRKPGNKKPGKMGAKKLGAQKVKTNFDEIEAKAENYEKEREASSRLTMDPVDVPSKDDAQVNQLSDRLMMQEVSSKRDKQQSKFKHDPNKAEQAERLGMGFVRESKASAHSINSSVSVIQQEGVRSKQPQYPKAFQTDTVLQPRFYDATDEWEVVSDDPPSSRRDDLFGMVDSYAGAPKKTTTDYGDTWDKVTDTRDDSKSKSSSARNGTAAASSNYSASDEASKKFGSAKAISSDMFFGNNSSDFETRSTLSKFDGATAISSADYYGGGPGSGVGGGGGGGAAGPGGTYSYGTGGYREQLPDMQDVKDSARAAASKVAGKFSNAFGSVQNYVQDNYNY